MQLWTCQREMESQLGDRIRQPFSKLTVFICKEKDFHSSLLAGFDDDVHILHFQHFFQAKIFFREWCFAKLKISVKSTWQNPWNCLWKCSFQGNFQTSFPQIYWKMNSFTVTFVQRFCKIWLVRFNSISGCFFKILYFK